ncbi:MAG: Hpt domain-containing protein [Saprospiraceae bacterium]|nr:Hpt domain-containing protein [Saprospiraceae bacterium]
MPSSPERGAESPQQAGVGPDNPLAFLEQLTGNNPARIRKYLRLYLEALEENLPRLEAARSGPDREEIRRLAHTLKPQLRMLGLEPLAVQAQTLETQALEGTDLDVLPEKVDRFIRALQQTVAPFQAYLDQPA